MTLISRPSLDISFLFISCMRSDLLRIAVESIRYPLREAPFRYEIVIADDVSTDPHATVIRELHADKLVVNRERRGLGANCNAGIAACAGRYICQIQDDWRFTATIAVFEQALRVFATQPDVGLIRLAPHAMRTDLAHEDRCSDGIRLTVYANDGQRGLRQAGARPYSDQPHIKRREFCVDVGPYKERTAMTWMELEYQARVANQRRWKVARMGTDDNFTDLGALRSLNPGSRHAARTQMLSRIPLIGSVFDSMRPVLRWGRNLVMPSHRIR